MATALALQTLVSGPGVPLTLSLSLCVPHALQATWQFFDFKRFGIQSHVG
jgi:hypothetical protein